MHFPTLTTFLDKTTSCFADGLNKHTSSRVTPIAVRTALTVLAFTCTAAAAFLTFRMIIRGIGGGKLSGTQNKTSNFSKETFPKTNVAPPEAARQDDSSKTPDYFPCMRVVTRECGYIGTKGEKTPFWPGYFEKITLENGQPLPLQPEDLVIHVQIYTPIQHSSTVGANNTPSSLAKLTGKQSELPKGMPKIMFLPLSLLSGIREGDILRFQYNGQPVAIRAEQGYGPSEDNFENYVRGSEQCFLNSGRTVGKTSLFCQFNPMWWYALGRDGAIYSIQPEQEGGRSEYSLALAESQKLPGIGEVEPTGCDIYAEGETIQILAEIPGCSREMLPTVDIIVNEKYLIVRFRRNEALDNAPVIKDASHDKISLLQWNLLKPFHNSPLEEMKQRLLHASVKRTDTGLLYLRLPHTVEIPKLTIEDLPEPPPFPDEEIQNEEDPASPQVSEQEDDSEILDFLHRLNLASITCNASPIIDILIGNKNAPYLNGREIVIKRENKHIIVYLRRKGETDPIPGCVKKIRWDKIPGFENCTSNTLSKKSKKMQTLEYPNGDVFLRLDGRAG